MKRIVSLFLSFVIVSIAFLNLYKPLQASAASYCDYSDLSLTQYMCNIIANHNYSGKMNNYGKSSNAVADVFDMYLSDNYKSSAHITASNCADSGHYAATNIYNLICGKMISQQVALEDYYSTIIVNILRQGYENSSIPNILEAECIETTTEITDSFANSLEATYGNVFDNFQLNLGEICKQDLSEDDIDALVDTYIQLDNSSAFCEFVSNETGTVSTIINTAANLSQAIQRLSYYSVAADFSDATKDVLYQLYQNTPYSNGPLKDAAWKVYQVYANEMPKAIIGLIEAGESLVISGIEYAVDFIWSTLLGPFSIAVSIGGAIGSFIANFCFASDDVNEQLLALVCLAEFEAVARDTAREYISIYKSNSTLQNAYNMKESLFFLLSAYKLGGSYASQFWTTAYTGGFVSKMKYGSDKDYPELLAAIKSKNDNVRMDLLSLETYKNIYRVDSPSSYDSIYQNSYTTAPGKAEYFGGSLYRLFDESMSWEQAKAKCESIGGHLVTISSQSEQDFLTNFISSSKKKSIWIGARTNLQQYYWINGEYFNYTNWDTNEPNNLKLNQYTAMMYTNKSAHTPGTWNDENENGTDWDGYRLSDFGFICEWDIDNELYVSSNSTYYNGSVYKIFDNSISWKEAAAHCAAAGGHLVTITSEAEQEVLTDLSRNSSKKNLWIGARTNGNNYYWITDENYSYTNWNYNEPNNIDSEQYTAMMYTHNSAKKAGEWNDENEFGRDYPGYNLNDFGYLCEWEIGMQYSLSPVTSTSISGDLGALDSFESVSSSILTSGYSTGVVIQTKNNPNTSSKTAPKKTLTVKSNNSDGEVLDTFYLNNNSNSSSDSFLLTLSDIAKYKEKTDNIYVEIEDESNDLPIKDVQYIYLGNIVIPMMGDTNNDELISIMDATIIQTYLAGLCELDNDQLDISDVEGDGYVSILDTTTIQKHLAKLDDKSMVGKAAQSYHSFGDVIDVYKRLSNTYKTLDTTGSYTNDSGFIHAGELLSEYEHFIKDQTTVTNIEVNRAYTKLSNAYNTIKKYKTTIDIYFSNNVGWGTVYAYVWNSDNLSNAKWPGEKMTYVGQNEFKEGIYKYTVEVGKYDHIIFSNNLASKTEDLDLTNKNNQGFYTLKDYSFIDYTLVYPCETYTYK